MADDELVCVENESQNVDNFNNTEENSNANQLNAAQDDVEDFSKFIQSLINIQYQLESCLRKYHESKLLLNNLKLSNGQNLQV